MFGGVRGPLHTKFTGTGKEKRNWVQSFKPSLLVFIPWDTANIGLDILSIYWKKCLWRKVGWKWEEPGRFLRPRCRSDPIPWRRKKRQCWVAVVGSKRESARLTGRPWAKVTHRRKQFLTELSLFHVPAGSPGKRGLCAKEVVNAPPSVT